MISIIMPVLNRGDLIEKAILSVIEQDYPHVELIILDGGSTDNTIDIIKRYEKHISYWHSKPDGSAALATNIGIEKSRGDLIGLLMADDYYEPGIFSKMAEAALAHPELDIFTCAGRMISFDEKTQAYETLETWESARQLQLNFYNICYGAAAICFRFIRRSVHDRIGVYIPFHADGKQMLTNDKEFLLRAVLSGMKDLFVNHLGYTHLAHAGSFSFGNHASTFERHCTEHMAIARQYLLQPDLSYKRQLFLKFWYHDQSAKLFLFQLLNAQPCAALKTALQAVTEYPFSWPLMFAVTSCRLLISRSLRLGASSLRGRFSGRSIHPE